MKEFRDAGVAPDIWSRNFAKTDGALPHQPDLTRLGAALSKAVRVKQSRFLCSMIRLVCKRKRCPTKAQMAAINRALEERGIPTVACFVPDRWTTEDTKQCMRTQDRRDACSALDEMLKRPMPKPPSRG